MRKINGRAWKFGDNIDTDIIIAARYLVTTNPKQLGAHCMEDKDKLFSKKVATGDVIVAGKNFGCGSSREHAALAIKGCGGSCVIAESFARIFYRNCINVGLPIFECGLASRDIKQGDKIQVDMSSGEIKNFTRHTIYKAEAFPDFINQIIRAGGLLNWLAKNMCVKD